MLRMAARLRPREPEPAQGRPAPERRQTTIRLARARVPGRPIIAAARRVPEVEALGHQVTAARQARAARDPPPAADRRPRALLRTAVPPQEPIRPKTRAAVRPPRVTAARP